MKLLYVGIGILHFANIEEYLKLIIQKNIKLTSGSINRKSMRSSRTRQKKILNKLLTFPICYFHLIFVHRKKLQENMTKIQFLYRRHHIYWQFSSHSFLFLTKPTFILYCSVLFVFIFTFFIWFDSIIFNFFVLIMGSRLTLAVCFFLLNTQLFANYVVNGNFSQPSRAGTYSYQSVYNWTGTNFILEGRYNIGYGQYINMQQTNSIGFIQQTITLPSSGNYDLTFYWKCLDSPSKYHTLLVFWNQIVVKTILPSFTNKVLFQNITLIGKMGTNKLMFMELPGPPSVYGYDVDQISIIQSFPTIIQPPPIVHQAFLNENQAKILASCFSTPLSQTAVFKSLFFLLDDLWLYNYDNQTYKGLISLVFWSATEIQNLKFTMMQSFINVSSVKDHLRISDYRNFSTIDFVEIEGSSSIFLDSNFDFLIYSVPQNILVGLALLILFRLTRQHRMSRYLRKYFFFKTNLLQVLIESNLAYFSFVCFNNLSLTFCFKWQDRAALIFTVVFLFGLLAFSFTYYFLIKIFLAKDSYHFVEGLYRCNASFEYLTLVHLLRNFLRGAISSVLHYNYGFQLLMLALNQMTSLILCLRYQLAFSIFHSSTICCLSMIYRFLFVLLNLALYVYWVMGTQSQDVKAFLLNLQSVIVYLFISVIILEAICKFLPINKGLSGSAKQKLKIQTNLDQILNRNIKNKEEVVEKKKQKKVIYVMQTNKQECEISTLRPLKQMKNQMANLRNNRSEINSKRRKNDDYQK